MTERRERLTCSRLDPSSRREGSKGFFSEGREPQPSPRPARQRKRERGGKRQREAREERQRAKVGTWITGGGKPDERPVDKRIANRVLDLIPRNSLPQRHMLTTNAPTQERHLLNQDSVLSAIYSFRINFLSASSLLPSV